MSDMASNGRAERAPSGRRHASRGRGLLHWLLLCCALLAHAAFAEARGETARGLTDGDATSKRAAFEVPKAHTAAATSPAWRRYKKMAWRRGYVTLSNPGNGRRWMGYVLGPGDTLLPKAERQVQALLASWRTGRSRPIEPELIRLIAQVSDVFGGRPIRVVSGYRERSHAKDSRHKHGAALDFSIDGVPNWAVRDYLRSLRHTGVGYYPNSSFVHVDVRGYPAYWIDLSGPGARPRYVAELKSPHSG
jgi:uncharacterized protein YcbK (DUF882 family)